MLPRAPRFMRQRPTLAMAFVIALLAFAVYGSALRNDFVKFDDDLLIVDNLAVHELSPASIGWAFSNFDPELYIPLTFISYQVDYAIGRGMPWIFHLTNILLHAANTILVLCIVRTITKDRRIGMGTALLFLLHPIQAEAVAWAAARKDLLAAFFFLSSALFYVHRDRDPPLFYGASLGSFLLSLLAKISAITGPIVFPLLDRLQGQPWNRSMLRRILPFLVLSILLGIVAVIGKTTTFADAPLATYPLLAAASTVFLLQTLILPLQLSVIYIPTLPVAIDTLAYAIPIALLLGCATALWILRRRSRSLHLWLCLSALLLLPSFATFTKAGDLYLASDRYAYLASMGIFAIVATAVCRIYDSCAVFWNRIIGSAAVLILLTLAVISHRQVVVWSTTELLFSQVLAVTDDSQIAHSKIGAIRIDQGNIEEALLHLRRSIAIRPTARAYYNIGLIELGRGDANAALAANLAAIGVDPDYVGARLNAGYLLRQRGDLDSALMHFERALQVAPMDPDVLRNLAVLNIEMGRMVEARPLVERLLKLDPQNAETQALQRRLSR